MRRVVIIIFTLKKLETRNFDISHLLSMKIITFMFLGHLHHPLTSTLIHILSQNMGLIEGMLLGLCQMKLDSE